MWLDDFYSSPNILFRVNSKINQTADPRILKAHITHQEMSDFDDSGVRSARHNSENVFNQKMRSLYRNTRLHFEQD